MGVVDIGCPACGRTLRVAEEHAGKQIRCPACQQISVVPEKRENTVYLKSGADPDTNRNVTSWHVRMPEGPNYGPIAWDEVLAWAAEGRIAADCELGESERGPWRKAGELIPNLVVSGTKPVGPASPTSYPWTAAEPYAPVASGFVAPHRGGLVLVLGLLGCMGCPLFSFVAWIMGSHDLREMRAGRMDKSGEGPTLAGMIFGMTVSLLWILAGIVLAAIVLIVAVAQL
jgi:phage FluMu protein Com